MPGRSSSALLPPLPIPDYRSMAAYTAAAIYCGIYFWFVNGWYHSAPGGFALIAILVCLFVFWTATMKRWDYWPVLAVLYGMRLFVCGDSPVLSDDLYRYLLDGYAQLQGVSPYSFTPEQLRTERPGWLAAGLEAKPQFLFLDSVNHPQLATIYLPASQLYFGWSAALAWLGLGPFAAFRLPVILLELMLLWRVRSTRHFCSSAMLLFASPLWLFEAQSIHQESFWVLVWLLLLAMRSGGRNRPGPTWVISWLITASVKPLSALTGYLVFLVRRPGAGRLIASIRVWLQRPATVPVLLVTLAAAGTYLLFLFNQAENLANLQRTLTTFTGNFQFNHPLYYYLVQPYRVLSFQFLQVFLGLLFISAVVGFWLWNHLANGRAARRRLFLRHFALVGCFVFLTGLYAGRTVHPWYFLWAYPLILCVLRARAGESGLWMVWLWQAPLLSYYVKLEQVFGGQWLPDDRMFVYQAVFIGWVALFYNIFEYRQLSYQRK